MNKFISTVTMAAVLLTATPAFADHKNRDYRWGVDHGHSQQVSHRRHHRDYDRHRNRNRGVSTGEAIAIGVGGLILGAAIASSNKRTPRVVEQYEYPPQNRPSQYVCQDVIQRDYYGNPYVAGRNCWYQ